MLFGGGGFAAVSDNSVLTIGLYTSNKTTLIATKEYFTALHTLYYRFYYTNTYHIFLKIKYHLYSVL